MGKSKTGYEPSEEIRKELNNDYDADYHGGNEDDAPLPGPWRNTSRDSTYPPRKSK